jgi:hypothetical protein
MSASIIQLFPHTGLREKTARHIALDAFGSNASVPEYAIDTIAHVLTGEIDLANAAFEQLTTSYVGTVGHNAQQVGYRLLESVASDMLVKPSGLYHQNGVIIGIGYAYNGDCLPIDTRSYDTRAAKSGRDTYAGLRSVEDMTAFTMYDALQAIGLEPEADGRGVVHEGLLIDGSKQAVLFTALVRR